MNRPILVAAVCVGLMVLARVFMGVLALLSGQVSILAVVLPVAVALLITGGLLALQGMPLFPMFFALGTRGARWR